MVLVGDKSFPHRLHLRRRHAPIGVRILRPVIRRQVEVVDVHQRAHHGTSSLPPARQPEQRVGANRVHLNSRRRLPAHDVVELLAQLDQRSLRLIGLHRRLDRERPRPPTAADDRARAVRPALVLTQVHVHAAGKVAAEQRVERRDTRVFRGVTWRLWRTDEDDRLRRIRPVDQIDDGRRRPHAIGHGSALHRRLAPTT